MNILQMRYFVAVADNLSFTIASKKLYVSQPSISKQVAALEDEIGMKLFDRTGKKLLLTNSGELLYHDFKILLQNIDELIQKAHDISDSVVGRLRISVRLLLWEPDRHGCGCNRPDRHGCSRPDRGYLCLCARPDVSFSQDG